MNILDLPDEIVICISDFLDAQSYCRLLSASKTVYLFGKQTEHELYKELSAIPKGTNLKYFARCICKCGDIRAMRYLIDEMFFINYDYGLKYAAKFGHIELVNYLIQRGAVRICLAIKGFVLGGYSQLAQDIMKLPNQHPNFIRRRYKNPKDFLSGKASLLYDGERFVMATIEFARVGDIANLENVMGKLIASDRGNEEYENSAVYFDAIIGAAIGGQKELFYELMIRLKRENFITFSRIIPLDVLSHSLYHVAKGGCEEIITIISNIFGGIMRSGGLTLRYLIGGTFSSKNKSRINRVIQGHYKLSWVLIDSIRKLDLDTIKDIIGKVGTYLFQNPKTPEEVLKHMPTGIIYKLFCQACKYGRMDVLKYLFPFIKFDSVNISDTTNWSYLRMDTKDWKEIWNWNPTFSSYYDLKEACFGGHLNVVQYLLEERYKNEDTLRMVDHILLSRPFRDHYNILHKYMEISHKESQSESTVIHLEYITEQCLKCENFEIIELFRQKYKILTTTLMEYCAWKIQNDPNASLTIKTLLYLYSVGIDIRQFNPLSEFRAGCAEERQIIEELRKIIPDNYPASEIPIIDASDIPIIDDSDCVMFVHECSSEFVGRDPSPRFGE
jgi:hypothetical protein